MTASHTDVSLEEEEPLLLLEDVRSGCSCVARGASTRSADEPAAADGTASADVGLPVGSAD